MHRTTWARGSAATSGCGSSPAWRWSRSRRCCIVARADAVRGAGGGRHACCSAGSGARLVHGQRGRHRHAGSRAVARRRGRRAGGAGYRRRSGCSPLPIGAILADPAEPRAQQPVLGARGVLCGPAGHGADLAALRSRARAARRDFRVRRRHRLRHRRLSRRAAAGRAQAVAAHLAQEDLGGLCGSPCRQCAGRRTVLVRGARELGRCAWRRRVRRCRSSRRRATWQNWRSSAGSAPRIRATSYQATAASWTVSTAWSPRRRPSGWRASSSTCIRPAHALLLGP